MANYGTVGGSKLAAGMSANNEDPNIPRLDLGFKPKRGATLEFYGTDGDESNSRKGQMRVTLGPDGKLIVSRYVSGERWEVIGGFGENGEIICGWRNTGWPGIRRYMGEPNHSTSGCVKRIWTDRRAWIGISIYRSFQLPRLIKTV